MQGETWRCYSCQSVTTGDRSFNLIPSWMWTKWVSSVQPIPYLWRRFDMFCLFFFCLFFLWQQERCVHFFMYRQFFLGGTSDTSLDVQLWPFIQIWSFRKSFLTPLCQKHWLKLNGVAEQSGDLMCLLLLIISTVNYRCLCSNWGYILYLLWPRIRVVSDFRVEIRSDQK